MKKPLILFTLLLSVVVVLAISQVVISNSLSTRGVGLDSLDQQIAVYKKKNALIKEKLLEISSFNYIASSAARIGFIEEKSRIFVSSSLPIAIRQ